MEQITVVVGGSISGLMHALVLRSFGHTVVVLEARSDQQLQARAAGLSLWPNAQRLFATCIPDFDMECLTVHNHAIQILAGDGFLIGELPLLDEVRTTGWNLVHEQLRRACSSSIGSKGPAIRFLADRTVRRVYEEDTHIIVEFTGEHGVEDIRASLVIAADGARSQVRSLVLPHVQPEYAGYLAWRGSIPEVDAPQQLQGALEGKLCNFKLDGSYILAYLSPGDNGSMQPGERHIEWCYYDLCDIASSEFADIMKDCRGIQHNITVAAEQLRPEAWASYRARRPIPPLWDEIFNLSGEPLLTAIRSFHNTKASFFSGKLFLAGEAYMQIRPHLGASCDIAALQALTLPQVLTGVMSLEEYERRIADHATEKAFRSKATGIFGLTGRWPDEAAPRL